MTKDITQIKNDIAEGLYSNEFIKLYGNEASSGEIRFLSALDGFEKHFGNKEVRLFSAPGRTELCGNHTDHQSGCVLAASIDLDMTAVVSKRSDCMVHIVSEGFGELYIDISDTKPKPEEKETTEALVRGLASAISQRGFMPRGFEAHLTSRVPRGSGLSSSAAFEVLVGKIFSSLFCDDHLEPSELAIIGQYAENEYFGKPCGLMDQMACAIGGVVFIDFNNQTKPKADSLDFSFEKLGYSLYITNAGGSHAELTDEYAAITKEMFSVAQILGCDKLGFANESEFKSRLPELRTFVSDRAILRAMHFFDEKRRVKQQLSYLKQGDMTEYLKLMRESGLSSMGLLQNLWPSDKSERSIALALAVSDSALCGEGVSRVHGGGFAGTIQALVPTEKGHAYKSVMDSIFGEDSCQAVTIRAVGAYELK